MARSRSISLGLATVLSCCVCFAAARAEESAPVPTSTPAAASSSAAAPASPAASAPAAAPTPTPAPAPVAVSAAAPAPAPAPAEPPAAKWYDAIKLAGFVDAYASVNANFPKPGVNSFRAFDGNTGFALHWAGIDASIDEGPVGATIGLRFGPSAPIYAGADANVGLTYVKQAYGTWKPLAKLTIDFGKFDQPFGSEVADSQLNVNYTRSALYWYAQPLFFTGLRVDYALSDVVDVKVFGVNGWNVTVDNNTGKSVGAQVTIKPNDKLLAAFGWLGGPEQADSIRCGAGTEFNATTAMCYAAVGGAGGSFTIDGANGRWRHLADFILDVTAVPKLRFLFNADFGTEKLLDGRENFYGANLVVGYAFSDVWSAALRGDVFHDEKGAMTLTPAKTTIVDGTLTLGASPTKNLLLKLDLRVDHVALEGQSFEMPGSSVTTKWQPTATLGVVATTN